MKQRRTSLKDLADKLGVSIATVSRALLNSHEVGEEMTQKVKQLAKELNYRPNPFAQSLRKEAPRVIGVIVPNLVTHYYAAVLDGIEDYASKLGYSVISANSHEDHEREAPPTILTSSSSTRWGCPWYSLPAAVWRTSSLRWWEMVMWRRRRPPST